MAFPCALNASMCVFNAKWYRLGRLQRHGRGRFQLAVHPDQNLITRHSHPNSSLFEPPAWLTIVLSRQATRKQNIELSTPRTLKLSKRFIFINLNALNLSCSRRRLDRAAPRWSQYVLPQHSSGSDTFFADVANPTRQEKWGSFKFILKSKTKLKELVSLVSQLCIFNSFLSEGGSLYQR